MSIDWNTIGAGVGALILSVITWFGGRATKKATTDATVAKAKAEATQSAAESSVVEMMRQEVLRLGARVAALEEEQRKAQARESRLIRHVFRLEGLLRGAGLEPPHFDIDGQPEKAGGTSAD